MHPLEYSNINLKPLVNSQESDGILANKNFIGKVWSWFKNNSGPILESIISVVAAGAIIGGLASFTFFFPWVMLDILFLSLKITAAECVIPIAFVYIILQSGF